MSILRKLFFYNKDNPKADIRSHVWSWDEQGYVLYNDTLLCFNDELHSYRHSNPFRDLELRIHTNLGRMVNVLF